MSELEGMERDESVERLLNTVRHLRSANKKLRQRLRSSKEANHSKTAELYARQRRTAPSYNLRVAPEHELRITIGKYGIAIHRYNWRRR